MKAWLAQLTRFLEEESSCVVVTIAEIQGSSPQSVGAKLLITDTQQWGTIGGGNLEYQATVLAREYLQNQAAPEALNVVKLGPSLGQCCGGVVTLVYQVFNPGDQAIWQDQSQSYLLSSLRKNQAVSALSAQDLHVALGDHSNSVDGFIRSTENCLLIEKAYLLEKLDEAPICLWVFGAGHVGKALINALAPLPFCVTWLDTREAIFPQAIPNGINIANSADPLFEINKAAAESWYLVMTHDHQQDFEIVKAILEREDFAHLGLIGSNTKKQRFKHRLAARGFARELIDRINCPIGIEGIANKQPEIIAASVVAQLLQLKESLNN